jgi:hypothetical protein
MPESKQQDKRQRAMSPRASRSDCPLPTCAVSCIPLPKVAPSVHAERASRISDRHQLTTLSSRVVPAVWSDMGDMAHQPGVKWGHASIWPGNALVCRARHDPKQATQGPHLSFEWATPAATKPAPRHRDVSKASAGCVAVPAPTPYRPSLNLMWDAPTAMQCNTRELWPANRVGLDANAAACANDGCPHLVRRCCERPPSPAQPCAMHSVGVA